MSWDAYTNEQLVGTGKVSHAAIIGLEGEQKGAVWAASPGFELKDDAERKAIADMFLSPPESPPKVTMVKTGYTAIRWDGTTYLGRQGSDGCVIRNVLRKAGPCIIIAVYKAPIQLQECLAQVERVAGYLDA